MPNPIQTVLVTGCSSGFGELTAKTLASHGQCVIACMRHSTSRNAGRASALRGWADARQVSLTVVDLDVTDQQSVEAGVASVLGSAGHIDVVVNNAGRGAVGPLEAFSQAQVEALFDLNVFGALRVNRAVLPSMRQRRSGLIIHVSSTIGRVMPSVGGLYAATKWALEGVAESLRYEVAAFGIDVVILEPGAFPSPAMSKAMVAEQAHVGQAYAVAAAAVNPPMDQAPPADYRPPNPQEVADAIERLIDLPLGRRPLRTVVGPIFTEGVAEYNAAYEHASRRLAAALQRPDQAITWGQRSVDG